MQIKYSTILEMTQAHKRLDNVAIIGEDAAKVRYSIARNFRTLARHAEDFNRSQNAILNQISGGSGLIARNSPEASEYQRQINELLNAEVDVRLFSVPFDSLDANSQLEPSALAALEPIFSGLPELGEPDK